MRGSHRLDELLDAELWNHRGRPRRGDDARLDALIDGAMGTGPPPGDGGSSPRPRPEMRGLAAVATTTVIAVVGWGAWPRDAPPDPHDAAAADLVASSERARPAELFEPRADRAPPAAPTSATAPSRALGSTRATEGSAVGLVSGGSGADPARGGPPVDGADALPDAGGPVLRARLDAATLLRRAGRARDQGSPRRAMQLYTRLFQEYPESREAATARVSAGRLELDVRRRPRTALRHFERYLRDRSSGTLVEEAMVGRALALRQLERTAEERRAWQRLIDRFPSSVHAARARARIEDAEEGGATSSR